MKTKWTLQVVLKLFAAKHLITKNLKSFIHAEKESSVQYSNKISVQLLFTCLNVFCSWRSCSLVNYGNDRALRTDHDDHTSPYCELVMAKNETTFL